MKKNSIRLLILLPILWGMSMTGCIRKTNTDIPDSEKKLDHLVILEVFYSGSYCKTGERKNKDGQIEELGYADKRNKYLKIYNPTDKEMYLDGLALVTSFFTSTTQVDFVDESQNFMDTHMAVSHIVYFPGTGNQYPIKPGEVKLITAWAGDYTKPVLSTEEVDGEYEVIGPANPESFDFTGAHFQWLSNEQLKTDIEREDYPANTSVPNMIPTYPINSNRGFDISHNQTIALIRFDKEELSEAKIDKHLRSYTLKFITTNEFTVDYTSLVIPNDAIIDAVTVAPTQEFSSRPVGDKVDAGSFGVTGTHSTAARRDLLGWAMRRKHDGKKYVDDNNSASDFEVVKAGLQTPDPLNP